MANASRERAAANSAAVLAEKNETPIVVDNTDPATLAQNNTGGPSVPSSTDDEFLAILATAGFDANGTITKATKRAVTARKGKQGKPLDARDAAMLPPLIAKITGEEGNEEDAEFGYATFVLHEDFVGKKKQIMDFVTDHNTTEIPIAVNFAKVRGSAGYDPKKVAENKGKKLVYAVMLSRGEQTEETDEITED